MRNFTACAFVCAFLAFSVSVKAQTVTTSGTATANQCAIFSAPTNVNGSSTCTVDSGGNLAVGASVTAGTAPSAAGVGAAGGLACSETTSTGWTPKPGQDYIRCDSTQHNFVISSNAGTETALPGLGLVQTWTGANVFSTDTTVGVPVSSATSSPNLNVVATYQTATGFAADTFSFRDTISGSGPNNGVFLETLHSGSTGNGSANIRFYVSPGTLNAYADANGQFSFQSLKLTGKQVLISNATPTIVVITTPPNPPSFSSGGASLVRSNGTADFLMNVGSGTIYPTGKITLSPKATTGWDCTAHDLNTQSAAVFQTLQVINTDTGDDVTETVKIGNFNSSGVAAPWASGDTLLVRCQAY